MFRRLYYTNCLALHTHDHSRPQIEETHDKTARKAILDIEHALEKLHDQMPM